MATGTKSRLTGERPQQGVTPDSLLALHEAGYRAVLDRIGPGRHPRRRVRAGLRVGEVPPTRAARSSASTTRPTRWPRPPARYGPEGLRVAQMDALDLGFRTASFDGGVLVAPHRALHRSRAPRRRAGPGAQGRRARLRAHPQQAGGLREPLPPATSSSGTSCGRCSSATSATCGSAGSTPPPT